MRNSGYFLNPTEDFCKEVAGDLISDKAVAYPNLQ